MLEKSGKYEDEIRIERQIAELEEKIQTLVAERDSLDQQSVSNTLEYEDFCVTIERQMEDLALEVEQLSVEDTVAGALEPVFVSEFRYYMWNVEPVLCAYCNERLSKATRTRDHVIPRSAGGPNGDNLVPSCAPCNRAKSDDPP